MMPHALVAAVLIACSALAAQAAPARLSILPFDNLSSRERHAYLGRAVAEMLTTEFARVTRLRCQGSSVT